MLFFFSEHMQSRLIFPEGTDVRGDGHEDFEIGTDVPFQYPVLCHVFVEEVFDRDDDPV